MLIEEAAWFSRQIATLSAEEISPMLNLGSSTADFRTRAQPWIDQLLFAPMRQRGLDVVHTDRKSAPGVDVVGDIEDPGLARRIASLGIRSVLCTSLLEHVQDRRAVCHAIDRMVPPGGYVFLSCPYRYPRHLDPIDTMFRPDVRELVAMLPGMEMLEGEIVSAGSYYDLIGRRPAALAARLFRLLLPFYHVKGWYTLLHHLPWLHRSFEITCVIMRKPARTRTVAPGAEGD